MNTFMLGIAPVEIFFQMFHGLTEWKGKDPVTGEHILQMSDFIIKNPEVKFEFMYSDARPSMITAMRLTAPKIGTRRWEVIKAPDLDEEEVDDSTDFEKRKGCVKGDENALREGMSIIGFTHHLIESLSGKEKELIQHLESKYGVDPLPQDEESPHQQTHQEPQ